MKTKKKRIFRITNPQKVEFLGHQYLDKPEMQLFVYNLDSFLEEQNYTLSEKGIPSYKDKTLWLNVHGIHDVSLINEILKGKEIPRFIVQDILDTNQRTKIQSLGDFLFLSVKSILPEGENKIDVEQISFILGRSSLYSFQEKKGDHFEYVRTRIRENNGLVRQKGPDFLLFLLIEGILANYYVTVDQMEEAIDENANPLKSSQTDPAIINRIESYKRKLLHIRKNITALRDALLSIEKEGYNLIDNEQLKYFIDLKINCLYLIECIDSMDLRLGSSENLFFSLQGHRMNQVMTTLTIMAAIFIPLTFLAGIYGMNFENMPELGWKWGYFSVLGVMVIIGLSLLAIFKKRKWF